MTIRAISTRVFPPPPKQITQPHFLPTPLPKASTQHSPPPPSLPHSAFFSNALHASPNPIFPTKHHPPSPIRRPPCHQLHDVTHAHAHLTCIYPTIPHLYTPLPCGIQPGPWSVALYIHLTLLMIPPYTPRYDTPPPPPHYTHIGYPNATRTYPSHPSTPPAPRYQTKNAKLNPSKLQLHPEIPSPAG